MRRGLVIAFVLTWPATAGAADPVEVATLDTKMRGTLEDFSNGAAFSPDGKLLAIAEQRNGSWDYIGESGHRITKEKYAKDGLEGFKVGDKILHDRSKGVITIWDVEKKTMVRRIEAHTQATLRVFFSPDGKLLASVGEEYQGVGYTVTQEPGTESGPLVMGSGGDCINGSIKIFDVATGKQRAMIRGECMNPPIVAFSADGRLIAGPGGTVADYQSTWVWEATTGKRVARLNSPCGQDERSALAFSPDDRLVAYGCLDGNVRVWDLTSQQRLKRLRPQGKKVQLLGLRFSADGGTLTATQTGRSLDWDTRRWQKLRETKLPPTCGDVAEKLDALYRDMSADGTLMAAFVAGERKVRVWKLSAPCTR